MTFNGCCGQPSRRGRRRDPAERLPPNPTPRGGVPMIFLGSARRDVRATSGLTYVVATNRRHFRAHPDDVDALLRQRDFILRP